MDVQILEVLREVEILVVEDLMVEVEVLVGDELQVVEVPEEVTHHLLVEVVLLQEVLEVAIRVVGVHLQVGVQVIQIQVEILGVRLQVGEEVTLVGHLEDEILVVEDLLQEEDGRFLYFDFLK